MEILFTSLYALYLAKFIVPALSQPWERYLPEYKGNHDEPIITTASQTQRGFFRLLEEIGTPATGLPIKKFGFSYSQRILKIFDI